MNHYEISIFKEKPDLFRKQYDNQLFLMSQGESLLLLLHYIYIYIYATILIYMIF